MSSEQYRLKRLSVANFRGFTKQQHIEVGGKHLFLFGPNGYGKSSVVEAIRWCLFGSPPAQQEIEARNTFFPSEVSEVVLELVGGLKLQRQLRPGQLRSRQTIKDGRGEDLRERDAFPQLTRLGQPTGTQVIFAAQQAEGRKQTDIADFGKVLYFHLHVQDVPELLDKLGKLKEERRNEREEMARRLDGFSNGLSSEMSSLTERKKEIGLNPPWGPGAIPTRAESDRRIDDFVRETARLAGCEILENLSNLDKLQKATALAAGLITRTKEDLSGRLRDREQRKAAVERTESDLRQSHETVTVIEAELHGLETELKNLLGSDELADLERRLAEMESSEIEKVVRDDIARRALDVQKKFPSATCPACGQMWTPETSSASADLSAAAVQVSPLDEMRSCIRVIKEKQARQTHLRGNLARETRLLGERKTKASELLRDGQVPDGNEVSQLVRVLEAEISGIRDLIKDAGAAHEARIKRVRDMETEQRFHDHQERVSCLGRILEIQIEDARTALADYDTFLNTADDVAKLLLGALDNTVKSALPLLTEKMSSVFCQLTNHPSYDGVAVEKGLPDVERLQPGKLDLNVTSTRRPGESYPVNVLNGQAARALHLVPYFVFSEFWKEMMELDLLLIDDPSESFDTSHIEHLMTVLKSVASHTQLVMASHEEDRVRPIVEKSFAPEQRCIVRVTDFDPIMGPTVQHG